MHNCVALIVVVKNLRLVKFWQTKCYEKWIILTIQTVAGEKLKCAVCMKPFLLW